MTSTSVDDLGITGKELPFALKFLQITAGETITGVVSVEVFESIHYDEFNLELGWWLRGKLNITNQVSKSIPLANNSTWEPEQTYTYDFEVTLDEPLSFVGQNIDLRWFVRTEMKLDSESKKSLRGKFLRSRNIPYLTTVNR